MAWGVGREKGAGEAGVERSGGGRGDGCDVGRGMEWGGGLAEEDGEEGEDEGGDEAAGEVGGTIHIPEFSRDCAEDEECAFEIKVENRKKEHREREDACYAALKKSCEEFIVGVLRQIDDALSERASH